MKAKGVLDVDGLLGVIESEGLVDGDSRYCHEGVENAAETAQLMRESMQIAMACWNSLEKKCRVLVEQRVLSEACLDFFETREDAH